MKNIAVRLMALATCLSCPVAALAQNLRGSVVADDTGTPIAGATVLAIRKRVSLSERPAITSAETASSGGYAMTVTPGEYVLCVRGAGMYLNPCDWGGAVTRTIGIAAVDVTVCLTKGARFILRAHDAQRLLPRAEAIRGGAVSASVMRPAGGPYPLPLTYDDGRVRDYGAILPMNVPLKVLVDGRRHVLVDRDGAAVNPQGVPFQMTAADFRYPGPVPARTRHMFPPPDAKVVHIYVAGLR